MCSGVYIIINRYNIKTYVGSSNNIERRFIEHRSHLRRGIHGNPHLQNAWNKYGEDKFDFLVLRECPVDEMEQLEEEFFEVTKCCKRTKGYNIRHTTQRNIVTAETRQRMSDAGKRKIMTPEHRANISRAITGSGNPFYGRKHSEETKKKISESHKGKLTYHNNGHAKAVSQFTKDDVFIKTFRCATEAAESLSCKLGPITKCARGESKTSYGFKWEYLD